MEYGCVLVWVCVFISGVLMFIGGYGYILVSDGCVLVRNGYVLDWYWFVLVVMGVYL